MASHLEKEGLQFIQFAFRWVNCLLLREVPFPLAVRLWDTYLAEGCVWGGIDVVFLEAECGRQLPKQSSRSMGS